MRPLGEAEATDGGVMRGIERFISTARQRCEAALEFGLRGGLTTVAIAFAIGAVAWPLFNLDAVGALAQNSLPWPERKALALTGAVVFGVFMSVFMGLVWWHSRQGVSAEETLGRINEALSWTLGLPLLVFLSVDGIEKTSPFLTLGLMSTITLLVGVSFYRLMAHLKVKFPRAYSESKVKRGVAGWVVVLMAIFAIILSRQAIALPAESPSLANALAALRGILDGDVWSGLAVSDPIGYHLEPILLLVAPFYALFPQVETLLVFQTIWLALGAIPVYLMANHALESRRAGGIFAACYLLLPAVHGAALDGFSALALLGPLVLVLLYCVQRRAWRSYYGVLVLCLLIRNDVAFFAAGLALSLVLSTTDQERKHGWTTLLVAAFYGTVTWVFMPIPTEAACIAGGGYGPPAFAEMVPHGLGVWDLLLSVWSNPAYALSLAVAPPKLLYLAQLGLPLLFLPLLASRGKVILGFGCALSLLASNPALYSITSVHGTWLYPVALALTPATLAQLRKGDRPWLRLDRTRMVPTVLAMLLVVGVLGTWKFGGMAQRAPATGTAQWTPPQDSTKMPTVPKGIEFANEVRR